MAKQQTIIGEALPNMPWEDKPAGYQEPVWRFNRPKCSAKLII